MRPLSLVLVLLVSCSPEVLPDLPGDAGADAGLLGGADAGSGAVDAGRPASGHQETRTATGATGSEPGGLIPVCCTPSPEEKADLQAVFELLNAHRAANGLAPLTYDDRLEAAVLGHCHHMVAHPFFDHDAPEAAVASPWLRAPLCGTTANAENIAWGQATPAAVMTSWKGSPGHNANMLGPYTRVGIGRSRGPKGLYWGQLFKQ